MITVDIRYTKRLRMPLDILMTVFSVILMGSTVLFPDDRIHQICGISLIVLWVVHIVLNRRWYSSLFKAKYQPYRIMQLVVNCGVLICALLLMISGLLMAWLDRKSTRLNSSHLPPSRMPSSA